MSVEDELQGAGRTVGAQIALGFGVFTHIIVGALTFLGGPLAYGWLPLWFLGLVGIVRWRRRPVAVLGIPWLVLGIMFLTLWLFGDDVGLRG